MNKEGEITIREYLVGYDNVFVESRIAYSSVTKLKYIGGLVRIETNDRWQKVYITDKVDFIESVEKSTLPQEKKEHLLEWVKSQRSY